MTHYRLNQPIAYGPVPGPPINPELRDSTMTTETKAKRTPGEWTALAPLDGSVGKRIFSGAEYIGTIAKGVNGDFLVHACNLHDELVAGYEKALACLTSQVKYVTDNRQAYGHNQDAADILKALLAKAQ